MHAKEIVQKIEAEAEMFAIIVPENLSALKNGGRISSTAAALENMLKIVPVLKVANGANDVETKVRTISKAHKVAMEVVTNVENKDDLTINGTGTLNMTSNHKDGICSKDDLKILNANISMY